MSSDTTPEAEPKANHIARLSALIRGALAPPPGASRIALALVSGVLCHTLFGLAVMVMIAAMYFGLSRGLGEVPGAWAYLANGALLAQFPLVHSLLLTQSGRRWLARLPLGSYASSLSTTTYATIASLQLLALFALWTPSGIIWWEAEGVALWLITLSYGASWLLLIKASFDSGPEVQSGALGWMSVLAAKAPVFPPMPETGLFRIIRHPIYLAFALTLWTVPVWTPDQLVLAVSYTAYCMAAPLLKERRFRLYYGGRFERYRAAVPYMLPRKLWRGR